MKIIRNNSIDDLKLLLEKSIIEVSTIDYIILFQKLYFLCGYSYMINGYEPYDSDSKRYLYTYLRDNKMYLAIAYARPIIDNQKIVEDQLIPFLYLLENENNQ